MTFRHFHANNMGAKLTLQKTTVGDNDLQGKSFHLMYNITRKFIY